MRPAAHPSKERAQPSEAAASRSVSVRASHFHPWKPSTAHASPWPEPRAEGRDQRVGFPLQPRSVFSFCFPCVVPLRTHGTAASSRGSAGLAPTVRVCTAGRSMSPHCGCQLLPDRGCQELPGLAEPRAAGAGISAVPLPGVCLLLEFPVSCREVPCAGSRDGHGLKRLLSEFILLSRRDLSGWSAD